ncbi:transposase domain-containing protein [Streptomyces sp. NPDC005167]
MPPHVMVHFAVGMALYADADYEEIITELSDALDRLGSWDADWEVPGSGAITRARQRLRDAVPADVLDAAAQPVAGLLTPCAFLSGWRLTAVDGFAEFVRYPGRDPGRPAHTRRGRVVPHHALYQ